MSLYDVKKKIKTTYPGRKLYSVYYCVAQKYEKKCIKNYVKMEDSVRLKRYRNIAAGKRCFIIGNGPSLSVEDLMLLINEDTFASNRIYGVFDKCSWRPSYYCIQDEVLLQSIKEELPKYMQHCNRCFLPCRMKKNLPEMLQRMKKVEWLFYAWRQSKAETIEFSKDCSHHIGASMTVTYAMIQLAVYMGYREIYLLGVDHNYVTDKNNKATTESYAAFIKETDLKRLNAPHLDLSTLAYIKAREECEKSGVKIWNVTRGGRLEVFERKNLEEVLVENRSRQEGRIKK